MIAFLAPVISWIFRAVVVKFLILTAVFAVMAVLLPVVVSYITPYISGGGLSNAFGAIDPGVWWFLDFFQLGYGVPLIISALVTRFLIRRLPFVG